ncbi:DNA-binding response regulator [Ktedonobacteria bacterium brp13]|nr:DNA-binding response regulator [Ktedonobacteria bacterium brp13]
MSKCIRVMIVDDHVIIRDGLRLMLEEVGEEFQVVGDATDGESALQLVNQLQPDVVLMDLRMPGMDGITTIEHMRQEHPQSAILILTTYNEDDLMMRGLQAGACGYLLKDTSLDTLLNAIRAAARGEILIQPDIMARILSYTTSQRPSIPLINAPVKQKTFDLTEREREVLVGVARGERSKDIARHLGIAERTVRAYLTNIYAKLDVTSRASAVTTAIRHGILPADEGK